MAWPVPEAERLQPFTALNAEGLLGAWATYDKMGAPSKATPLKPKVKATIEC